MLNSLAVKANLAAASLKERAANKAEKGGFDKLIVTIILVAAAVVIGGAIITWFRAKTTDVTGQANSGLATAGNGGGALTLPTT